MYVSYKGGRCRWEKPLGGNEAVVVTGGNTGIGFVTCLHLARTGATVLIGARDRRKGEDALKRISSASGNPNVHLFDLDLSSIASVDHFVNEIKDFLRKHQSIHLYGVVANAGVMMCPWGLTKDGFETQVGTNHLGHFRLVTGLYEEIKAAGSRVVVLSSSAHLMAKLNLDDLLFHDAASYSRYTAYGNSKLCNMMFAHELNRRLVEAGSRARAFSVHPGVVDTELGRHIPLVLRLVSRFITKALYKTPEQGAQTTLTVLFSDEVYAHSAGQYHADCKVARPGKRQPLAYDAAAGAKLWDASARLLAAARPAPSA